MKMMMDTIITEGLQTRKALQPTTVKAYAKQMAEGVEFAPVTVYSEGGRNYLADGFHRLAALRLRGETAVEAEVRTGGFAEALRHALSANARHGAKRTHDDILNGLWMAYSHRQELFGGEPTVEQLMSACDVSRRTVQRNRWYFTAENPEPKKRPEKRGASLTPPLENGEISATGTDGKPWETAKLPLELKQLHWRRRKEDRLMAGDRTELERQCGTFGHGDDAALEADVFGHKVPRRLRKELSLTALEGYNRAWMHALRAYDMTCGDENQFLMKPVVADFMDHLMEEGGCLSPNEVLAVLVDAFHRHQFLCVCPECGGAGCPNCGKKGFWTLADCDADKEVKSADSAADERD
ncbi:MAG: ParB N-terminal domain-containing protein [Kiritimatiellae bacterium]|nr:ParB N-terminal domain-containing protein [Kiritimatiellia bacterium]